jgi:23S rRNA (uracil1939-C5)-methyltransferase
VNEILDLTIERPVAGGRMLARHDGRIVFVAGAIPGERVRARVERVTKQSWWASTIEVIEPSADRRVPPCDPRCGGSTFAHMAYDRQRELKQEILVDAFRRLGHLTLDPPPAVAASPESGYRLRSRLHASNGRLGFYLEGTHTLCDAAATAQLSGASLEAASAVFAAMGSRARDCDAVVVSENIAATERVIHLEPRAGARLDDITDVLARAPAEQLPGVTGITTVVRGGVRTMRGDAAVRDTAAALFGASPPIDAAARWTRRAPAFFQGNRFLLGSLVRAVLERVDGERVADLYAGVGLFSVALAARGLSVTAVEGEPFAAADLAANARPWGERLRVVRAAVEDVAVRSPDAPADAVILDPPRTGASARAIEGVASWRAPRIVYVSCDPPTLARDAARLVARGYRLERVTAFDMFPNTPHVEAVAEFARA